jgi:hypothetical protein
VALRPGQTIGLVTVATTLACAGESRPADQPSAVARRDSAGIEIVESSGNAPADWAIDTTFAVRVGTADDALKGASYQFVGIKGAARMRNGHIVVADAGASEVRVFDSTGTFLRTLVRKGAGPGELYEISALYRTRDDSIFVLNSHGSALAVFAPDLSVVRTIKPIEYRADSLRRPYSHPGVHGIFDDGSVLGVLEQTGNSSKRSKARDVTDFSFVDSTLYSRGVPGPQGRQVAQFGWIVSSRGHAFRLADRTSFIGEWLHTNLLEPNLYLALRGTDLYVANRAVAEVVVYGEDGRLKRIVRAEHPPVPVRAGDLPTIPRDGDRRSLNLGDRRVTLAGRIPDLPALHPVVTALRVDPSGNVWLRCLTGAQPRRNAWLVFDSTGALRHRVVDPLEMGFYEIGDRHVVAGMRDSDDVPSVVVRRINKR